MSQLQKLCHTQHEALRTGSKVLSGCAPASSTGPSSHDKTRATPPSTLPSTTEPATPRSNAHQSQTLPSDTLRAQGSTAQRIPVAAETGQVRWKSLKKKKGERSVEGEKLVWFRPLQSVCTVLESSWQRGHSPGALPLHFYRDTFQRGTALEIN